MGTHSRAQAAPDKQPLALRDKPGSWVPLFVAKLSSRMWQVRCRKSSMSSRNDVGPNAEDYVSSVLGQRPQVGRIGYCWVHLGPLPSRQRLGYDTRGGDALLG